MVLVLKAMGAESDQEAVQLVGEEPAFADLMMATVQECKGASIFTQAQALEFLGE
jgi:DNA-directed RNA polymerase III subunit RPC2